MLINDFSFKNGFENFLYFFLLVSDYIIFISNQRFYITKK